MLIAVFLLSGLARPLPATAQREIVPFPRVESTKETDVTTSVAWGDYDGDGDLDLAVGNAGAPTENTTFQGQKNRLYRNDGGTLIPAWLSSEADATLSVAWGDYDRDGDLDLAVGNYDQPNRIYRNDGGVLTQAAVWSAPAPNRTSSVAWGDYDGDGDLDLAVGNGEVVQLDAVFLPGALKNQLYRNDGTAPDQKTPVFNLAWTAAEADPTSSVAWGDVDGDGDLDLAVGNIGVTQTIGGITIIVGDRSRLYRNQGGALSLDNWRPDVDITFGVVWGDYDRDGDLDLAAGNAALEQGAPNKLYRNDSGTLSNTPIQWSPDHDATLSIAWGDYDGDGDLDIAAGNAGPGGGTTIGQLNRLYRNDNGVLSLSDVGQMPQSDDTFSVAWGDIDGDGDLDLAAGNGGALIIGDAPGQPNRLYYNQIASLSAGVRWTNAAPEQTSQVAWGDVDGDGDLDLAVARNGQPSQLYRNQAGQLTLDAAWAPAAANTLTLAWGDVDGDGDLDLALGNAGQPSQLYRNQAGQLTLDAAWTPAAANTTSLAWGDVDGDDDLDLALGNYDQPSQLYRNQAGQLTLDAAWTPPAAKTTSLAWGDVDGDGGIDLALGNYVQPSQLYRNQAGQLTLDAAWTPPAAKTTSLAWGDADGDGDLDLAVGNMGQQNLIYFNDGRALRLTNPWISTETDQTTSLAWGDYDGDGDLDLAVGNSGIIFNGRHIDEPDRIYRNDGGALIHQAIWSSKETEATFSVAWGDVDNDGDIDLATTSNIYRSGSADNAGLADNPPRVTIAHPGSGSAANFYASETIIRQQKIAIQYSLADPEGNPVRFIRAFYSPNGGGQWFPATAANGVRTTNLEALPGGTSHTFTWDVEADLIKSDSIVFRIEAYQGFDGPGPYQRPYRAAQTLPFRVEAAPWYATVVDEAGRPMPGATLYLDGKPVVDRDGTPRHADRAGRIKLDPPAPGQSLEGQTLVALSPGEVRTTKRKAHDNWAYRIHLTNAVWTDDGQLQAFKISRSGEQRLVLRRTSPLVLFNIVVSIEWDTDDAYIEEIKRAMQRASAYLFDVTDGHMVFQQVSIYDGAEHWADADIQISAKNIVHPYAWVGGVVDDDTSHIIRLGRGWDGNSGDHNSANDQDPIHGAWDLPDGYRTIGHEFGHYALGLYDSYFGYILDESGDYGGIQYVSCTGEENRNAATYRTNATFMDYQYWSSEMTMRGVAGLWSDSCEATLQWQFNQESDWETVARNYGDASSPPRWQFTTPRDRGHVLAGPDVELDSWPTELPAWPQVSVAASDPDRVTRQLEVTDAQGNPYEGGAIVTLYKQEDMRPISQGITRQGGRLAIYGARDGDTLRAASLDGGLTGSTIVSGVDLHLTLNPVNALNALSTAGFPSVRIIAEPGPTSDLIDLNLFLRGFDASTTPQVLLTEPGSNLGFTAPLSYSASIGGYTGKVSFSATARGTGRLQVTGTASGQQIELFSTYRLHEVQNNRRQDVYADDGNLYLHMASASLPGSVSYVIVTPGSLPGPLPPGMQFVSNVYDLTASGSASQLQRPGMLTFYYGAAVAGSQVPTGLALYHWDPSSASWQKIASALDENDHALVAAVRSLGSYALLAPLGQPQVYLPLVMYDR